MARQGRQTIDLSESSVAVTGGGGGLGGAIALDLAACGATVFALDLAVALERQRFGEGIVPVPVDLTDQAAVQQAYATVASNVRQLDALVASAGIQLHHQDGPLGEVSLETWQRTIDVNLTGAFLSVKHALPLLLAAGTSSVVLIGSPTGLTMSGAGNAAYSASKAGMMALGRTMAADYAAAGLRANVVVPGTMRTPLIEPLLADPQIRAALLAGLPIGRLGEPDDLTGLVRWLVSAESRFATGGFFAVDGGLTAR